MSTWDSADLLTQFNELTGRPDADEVTDARKYARLARAQQKVVTLLASVVPDALYQAPAALTNSGDSKVFTFGTDGNGHAVMPMGHVQIAPRLECFPDDVWAEGYDYVSEGTQIRIPNNRTSSHSTLYGRWVPTPSDISASTEPSLRPAPSRRLIVLQAAKDFAREGALQPELLATVETEWREEFPRWCLVYRTQFRQGGAVDVGGWYRRSPDLS